MKHVCQHCGEPIEASNSASEKEVICAGCGNVVRISLSHSEDSAIPKLALPPITPRTEFPIAQISAIAQQIIANVETVIAGKHEQVSLATAVLLAEGHLLVEDVPGVAKTMLARAIAHTTGCSFKRIQCTPDLQPSDVLGEPYVDRESGQTSFRFGPIFSQFVLVDEINRASPRTQAALLEAMGEATVTTDNVAYKLERPFMVIATQNPIEQEGTFLLPEAQKDRFLVRMSLGYPSLSDEKQMCEKFQLRHPIETLKPVTSPDQITKCQTAVREVRIDSEVCDYILALVRATREHPALRLGASPRASLGLFRMAQAIAAIHENSAVLVEQVKAIAPAVLCHRLIAQSEGGHSRPTPEIIVKEILDKTLAPTAPSALIGATLEGR